MAKKSEQEHASVTSSTPGLASKEADSATHDGTVVSITADQLIMTNQEGLEHSHALTADAKLTLHGGWSEAGNEYSGDFAERSTARGDPRRSNRQEPGVREPRRKPVKCDCFGSKHAGC